MAAVSAFSALPSICRPNSQKTTSRFSPQLPIRNLALKSSGISNSFSHLRLKQNKGLFRLRKLRSVEEETLVPEAEEQPKQEEKEEEASSSTEQQPVSVPVSPSDTLTMFFQAEGTISESSIPTVTKALEQTEGISNIKVQVLEGIGSVELTKQTTVQATGVASSLIETIQGSGFKLQTLNLSFEDEEEILV